MINTEQEIDDVMSQWMQTKRFTPDAKTNAAIRQRVEENLERLGGYPSIASFERAALELMGENVIAPFRGSISEHPTAAPAIPPDTIAFIESPITTASQLRNRYNTDPTFRKQYDLYEKTKGQTRESSGGTLTVEEYRKMRAADVVQRYRRDAAFKSGVDKLIAQGKI
jgi:hypothetical protein